MDIDADGPATERATVKFKNADAPGIFISGQKLANDVTNFRRVAEFLAGQSGDGPRLSRMMATLADQFEKAANGAAPNAT